MKPLNRQMGRDSDPAPKSSDYRLTLSWNRQMASGKSINNPSSTRSNPSLDRWILSPRMAEVRSPDRWGELLRTLLSYAAKMNGLKPLTYDERISNLWLENYCTHFPLHQ